MTSTEHRLPHISFELDSKELKAFEDPDHSIGTDAVHAAMIGAHGTDCHRHAVMAGMIWF